MRPFDEKLLRLKQELRVTEDRQVAAALGMSPAALTDRKKRASFPDDKVRLLARLEPARKLNVAYILDGQGPVVTITKTADKVAFLRDGAVPGDPSRELQLLENYRLCRDTQRLVLEATAATFAQASAVDSLMPPPPPASARGNATRSPRKHK